MTSTIVQYDAFLPFGQSSPICDHYSYFFSCFLHDYFHFYLDCFSPDVCQRVAKAAKAKIHNNKTSRGIQGRKDDKQQDANVRIVIPHSSKQRSILLRYRFVSSSLFYSRTFQKSASLQKYFRIVETSDNNDDTISLPAA